MKRLAQIKWVLGLAAFCSGVALVRGEANTPLSQKDEDLSTYLSGLKSQGIFLIWDCPGAEDVLEPPVPENSGIIENSFYTVTVSGAVCRVIPRLPVLRTTFLNTRIDALDLKNKTPEEAVALVGRKLGRAGLSLFDYKERLEQIRITETFRGQTVESILMQISKACGSNRVLINAGFTNDGQRVTGMEEIQF